MTSKTDEARRLAQSALGRASVLTGDTELEKVCAVVEAMADEIDSLRAEVVGLRAQNDCYDEQLERWTLRVRRRNEELEKLRAELERMQDAVEASRSASAPGVGGAPLAATAMALELVAAITDRARGCQRDFIDGLRAKARELREGK